MRLAERMTEKQLKAVTKTRACGGVPGLVCKVENSKTAAWPNTSFWGNQPPTDLFSPHAIRRCRSRKTLKKKPLTGK